MMLATRCPYCRTTFRVVQDQLKLCNGIVRCGSCRQVFNGIEQLQSADAGAQAMREEALAQEKAAQEQAQAWPASADANLNPVTIVADDPPLRNFDAPKIPAQPRTSSPLKTPEPAEDLNLILTPVDEPLQIPTALEETPDPLFAAPARPLRYDYEEPHLNLDPHYEARQEPRFEEKELADPIEREPHLAEDWTAAPDAPDFEVKTSPIEPDDDDPAYRVEIRPPVTEPAYEEPAFVQRAKRQERYGRIGRIALVLLVLVLLPAFFLQTVDAFHLRIAAMLPDAKPALNQICNVIGCGADLPSQIDAVSIDSYELHSPTKGETAYTLKVLIRNRSALAQAWPHFELTLKDATETPIVRRVFKANDYLSDRSAEPKGLAGNSEYAIKLQFDVEPPLKPVGYEVYLFYS